MMATTTWAEQLLAADISACDGTSEHVLRSLCQLGLRRNPKRAHLLVSPVLGKHIPASPTVVLAVGRALGWLAGNTLAGTPQDGEATSREALSGADFTEVTQAPPALVVGFAETATGLGQAAAEVLPDSAYVHSTRLPKHPVALEFQEAHSHATDHSLAPRDPSILSDPRPVVLVDDEFSTGKTVMNVIRRLHEYAPHPTYVIASILDMRSDSDREQMARLSRELEVPIHAVSLAKGSVDLPDNAAERTNGIRPTEAVQHPVATQISHEHHTWPASVPLSGDEGLTWRQLREVHNAAEQLALQVGQTLPAEASRIHVLGWEELMHVPTLVAGHLEEITRTPVRVSTTTRSPAHVLRADGYPLRTGVTFSVEDGTRHAYNVEASSGGVVVVVAPPDTDTLPLVAALKGQVETVVVVHTHPTPSPRIWLTGTSGNGALQARCLSDIPGVVVHGSDRSPRSALSAFCDYFHLEPVAPTREEFRSFLLSQAAEYGVDLLIPRRGLRTLVAHRDEFEAAGVAILAPTEEAVRVCTDKSEFLNRAQKAGALVAKSFRVTTPDELDAAAEAFRSAGLRMCVKPAAGHGGLGFFPVGDANAGFENWTSFREHESTPQRLSLEELRRVLAQYPQQAATDPLLLCEYLPGPEISVDCWSDGNSLRGHVMRLKESGVIATYAVAVDLPELLAKVEAVAAACGLLDRNCVFNMQFRRAEDGTWRLQEANPRPSGGTHISAAFGANLLAAAASWELGLPYPEPLTPAAGTTLSIIPDAFPIPALSSTSQL